MGRARVVLHTGFALVVAFTVLACLSVAHALREQDEDA